MSFNGLGLFLVAGVVLASCGGGDKAAAPVATPATAAPLQVQQACITESASWLARTTEEWAGHLPQRLQWTGNPPVPQRAIASFGHLSPYVGWISAATWESMRRQAALGHADAQQYQSEAAKIFCSAGPTLESRGWVSTLPIEALLPVSATQGPPPTQATPPTMPPRQP